MNWPWHRHTFNPNQWEKIHLNRSYGDGWGNMTKLPTSIVETYKNTCLTCGDVVFRKVDL